MISTIIFLILIGSIVIMILIAMADVYEDLWQIIGSILIAAILILVLVSFRWQISDQLYTGYIYSRDSVFGYTTYHIRFSKYAGEDKQPSFSVRAGSDEERELDRFVGTDKPVRVMVKASGPRLVDNPFEPHGLAEIAPIENNK